LKVQTELVGEKRIAAADSERDTNRRTSSTNPARNAWAASAGPPMLRSRSVASFIARTAFGANVRSIRVRALLAVCKVVEYTILSAAYQSLA
jgi:hypothetical protein